MSDQKKLIAELKKGWVYAADPDVFFRGYDVFSEMLRNAGNCNPGQLLASYQETIERIIQRIDETQGDEEPSFANKIQLNDKVLRYQLLRRARLQGSESETEEFYHFADELVKSRCVTSVDEKSATFLAYQGTISRADDAYAALRKDIDRPDQESRTRRKLLRVFERFNEQNREKFFGSLLGGDGKGTECFDAICSVHHQVVDNIDHWMDYPENPNWQEANRSLFGDTLVLRVSRLTFANYVETNFSKNSASVRDYLEAVTAERNTKQGLFWRLDYFDNGRGILRNLGRFGGFDDDNFDLLEVIKNKMSIRGNVGPDRRNGEGFSIIIDEAIRKHGYFSLVSEGQQVLSSIAHGSSLMHKTVDEFQFGTHLSVIFPG